MQLLKKAIVILLCLGILCSLVGCISPFTKKHEMPNFDHDEEFLEKKEAWDQKEADLDDSKSLMENFDFTKYEKKDVEWSFCNINLKTMTIEDILKIKNSNILVLVDKGESISYNNFETMSLEECKRSDLVLMDKGSALGEKQTFTIKVKNFNDTKATLDIYFTAPLETVVQVKDCLTYRISYFEWTYEDENDICSFFGLTDIPAFKEKGDLLIVSRLATATAVRAACQTYGKPTGVYRTTATQKGRTSSIDLCAYYVFWEKENYIASINIFETNSYQGIYLAKEKRWSVWNFEISVMDKEYWAELTADRPYTDKDHFTIF